MSRRISALVACAWCVMACAGCADRGATRACPAPGASPGVDAAALLVRGAGWVPANAAMIGIIDTSASIDALADTGELVRIGEASPSKAQLATQHAQKVRALTDALAGLSRQRAGVDLTRASRLLVWQSRDNAGLIAWGVPASATPPPRDVPHPAHMTPDGALVFTHAPLKDAPTLASDAMVRQAYVSMLRAAAPGKAIFAARTSAGGRLATQLLEEELGRAPQGITLSVSAQVELAVHDDEAALDAVQETLRARHASRSASLDAKLQRAQEKESLPGLVGDLMTTRGAQLLQALALGERRPGRLIWSLRLEQSFVPLAHRILAPLAFGGDQ